MAHPLTSEQWSEVEAVCMGAGKQQCSSTVCTNLHYQQERKRLRCSSLLENLTSFWKNEMNEKWNIFVTFIFSFLLFSWNKPDINIVTLWLGFDVLMWCHTSENQRLSEKPRPQLLTSRGCSQLSNHWLSWLYSDMQYSLKSFLELSVSACCTCCQ